MVEVLNLDRGILPLPFGKVRPSILLCSTEPSVWNG